MGSSNRKKKEKKKDFQKPKLKVGKTKAKPSNFTDTSFKSKGITYYSFLDLLGGFPKCSSYLMLTISSYCTTAAA